MALLLVIGWLLSPLPVIAGDGPMLQPGATLRIAVRQSAATCQRLDGHMEGLECALAKRLAVYLGVPSEFSLVATSAQARAMVRSGEADIAITGTPFLADPGLRPGPGYLPVSQCLIYRYGSGLPRRFERISAEQLLVPAGSGHLLRARKMANEHPGLGWTAMPGADSAQLLHQLSIGALRYTLAYSHELSIYQHYYPSLRCAGTVATGLSLNWSLPAQRDPELSTAVAAFFQQIRANGELSRLLDRHLGLFGHLDYVSTSRFLRRIDSRLPRFRAWFEQAAANTGFDWRLLAAIAYQESHWDVGSVSPTGVKGLMMLTEATARQMGIRNRLDPAQSIDGGARYLRRVKGKIPQRIAEPDRSWLALAAYNIGFGHLEDARILTQRQGGNPDHWPEVRERLPLLGKARWARTVRRGGANGVGAVEYVRNIRGFYDILRWRTGAAPLSVAQIERPSTDN